MGLGNVHSRTGNVEPRHLIAIAKFLATKGVSSSIGRPRQADLRRALSTAYYAMFHALYSPAENFARGGVAQRIEEAVDAISDFERVPLADRRALAIYMLLRIRQ